MEERYCPTINWNQDSGELPPGERLYRLLSEVLRRDDAASGAVIQSERQLADAIGIDRSVVHRVYERLIAERLLIPLRSGRRCRIAVTQESGQRCIGIILPGRYSEYVGQPDSRQRRQTFLNGIVDRAMEAKLDVCFWNLPPPDMLPRDSAPILSRRIATLAGAVHLGTRCAGRDLPLEWLLAQADFPQVSLACRAIGTRHGSVSFSAEQGLRTVAGYFREHNHRKGAVFCCIPKCPTPRYFEYELWNMEYAANLFRAAGIAVAPEHLCCCRAELGLEEACREQLTKLLASDDPPSALWCRNDALALEVIRQLRAAGFRVPEEFSVIGMDDIAEAQEPAANLTTLRIPFYECGREAVEMLLAIRAGKSINPLHKLPPLLVERGSVGYAGTNSFTMI